MHPNTAERLTIGLISDTHGLLRPEAASALAGVDLIVHAGDVGREEILDELRRIAPVWAVRGNVDTTAWAQSLPETEVVECGRHRLYVIHDVQQLDLDPAVAGMSAVISGHTHQPRTERRNGVLFVNPGSAGPRRFQLPVSLAKLQIDGDAMDAELIELAVG